MVSLSVLSRPAKILPGLYISGITAAQAAVAPVRLHRFPIFRSLLSLGDEVPSFGSSITARFTHKHLSISTLPAQNLLSKLDEACSFIRNSIRNDGGGSILVYCLDGLNLSPAVAIAYLMQAKSLGYDAALAVVRAARPNAMPAPHFEDQLRIWSNMGCCIYDATGHEKLPYVLWKTSMKDTTQRQKSELAALKTEAEVEKGGSNKQS